MESSCIWADIWVTACPPHFETDSLISLTTFLNSLSPSLSHLFVRLRCVDCLSLDLVVKLVGRGYEIFKFWLKNSDCELLILPEIENHNPLLISSLPGQLLSPNPSQDQEFLENINKQRQNNNKPPLSLTSFPSSSSFSLSSSSQKILPKFKSSCVGGTFDHLHDGHRVLLTATALAGGEFIQVGVSGDPLLTKKKMAHHLQPFEVRKKTVEAILGLLTSTKLDVFPLDEPFGPTITNPTMDVIILSEETKNAIKTINEKRKENELKEIESVVVGYLLDVEKVADFEKRLREGSLDEVSNEENRMSSTSIRKKLEAKKEAKI